MVMVMRNIYAVLLLLGITASIDISIPLHINDKLVIFGDSVPFYGSISSEGFVNLLQPLIKYQVSEGDGVNTADAIVNAGQRHFDVENFVNSHLLSMLDYYQPTVALLMVTDDEFRRILKSWLREVPERDRVSPAAHELSDDYDDEARTRLASLERSLTSLAAKVSAEKPECRMIFTTPLPGVHDPPPGGGGQDGRAHDTEAYRQEAALRERLNVILKSLSFDFSPPPEVASAAMQHYRAPHQHSRHRVQLLDIGYALGRARDKARSMSVSMHRRYEILTHGADGSLHLLHALDHSVLASAIATCLDLQGDTTQDLAVAHPSSRSAALKEFNRHIDSLLKPYGITVTQVSSWQRDINKAYSQAFASRAAHVRALQQRDHEERTSMDTATNRVTTQSVPRTGRNADSSSFGKRDRPRMARRRRRQPEQEL